MQTRQAKGWNTTEEKLRVLTNGPKRIQFHLRRRQTKTNKAMGVNIPPTRNPRLPTHMLSPFPSQEKKKEKNRHLVYTRTAWPTLSRFGHERKYASSPPAYTAHTPKISPLHTRVGTGGRGRGAGEKRGVCGERKGRNGWLGGTRPRRTRESGGGGGRDGAAVA